MEPSGQERYIAETFCSRAAPRVESSFDQIEDNDDERMTAIAKLAYKRGSYGYASSRTKRPPGRPPSERRPKAGATYVGRPLVAAT